MEKKKKYVEKLPPNCRLELLRRMATKCKLFYFFCSFSFHMYFVVVRACIMAHVIIIAADEAR